MATAMAYISENLESKCLNPTLLSPHPRNTSHPPVLGSGMSSML